MSNNPIVPTICFGDTVRLKSNKIGTVSFIGYTQFRKGTIYYGINLKEPTGGHNGTYDNVRYFKCAPNHGLFVEAKDIIEITKKISVSASYYHGQKVKITDGIGTGQLLYIGLAKYDGFQNYLYGVKLDNNLNPKTLVKIYKNPHIYYFNDDDDDYNEYFDGDSLKDAIFVRQNQLRHCSEKKKRSIFGMHFGSKKSRNNHNKDGHANRGHFEINIKQINDNSLNESNHILSPTPSSPRSYKDRLSIDASKENILPFNGCLTPQKSMDEEKTASLSTSSKQLMLKSSNFKRKSMVLKPSQHSKKSKIPPKKPTLSKSRSMADKDEYDYDYDAHKSQRNGSRKSNHARSHAMFPLSKKSKSRAKSKTLGSIKDKSKGSPSKLKSRTKSKSKSKSNSKSKANSNSPKNSRKSSKAKSRPSSKSRPIKPTLSKDGHIVRAQTERTSPKKKPAKIQVPDDKRRTKRSKSSANITSPVPSSIAANSKKNKKKEKVKPLKPAKKVKKRGRSKGRGPGPNAKSRRTSSSPIRASPGPSNLSPAVIVSNYGLNVQGCISDWNVDDVVLWLKKVDNGRFKQYAVEFKKNEINGEDLKRCTDEHLKRIGINRYFDRTDILNEIQNLLIDEYHANMSRWSIMSINCL